MIGTIKQQAAAVNTLETGGIFNNEFNQLILDTPGPQPIPDDGMSGKRYYKYRQYNKMIKLRNMGKKKFNPRKLIVGKG